ncbi:MAG: HAMP domain-containing histidine kinase [Prevotellaceae bacterium]|jgi:signal transduction histidine kinase|nr:HAMP domain-containing histidine kinase [Prevotellaceae bacterium]
MATVLKADKKRLSRTRQEQERLIRQELTQNLSHELKTPVSSILGYIETLVLNPDLEPEKVRFFIERCFIQTQRLSRLIEDISLLNQLDHVPERFPFESIDLFQIIDNVLKDVSLQLLEKCVQVVLPPLQRLMVFGNDSLLYSIFRNLIDNAITYAGTNVTISISWIDKGDSFLYFSFSDDGPGVDPEHLPHLFDRFYRIDSGRSRKQGGTGLGLSIVKNGIMAHGGSVEAFTDGKGLTFLFKLRK